MVSSMFYYVGNSQNVCQCDAPNCVVSYTGAALLHLISCSLPENIGFAEDCKRQNKIGK